MAANNNSDKAEMQPPQSPDGGSGGGGKSILLVEDDPFLVKMYVDKFEKEGLNVETSDNGIDGLDKALKGDFDLVLLDLLIPKLSGLEFLKKLRADQKGKAMPVMVLTNVTEGQEQFKAKDYEVVDYLLKANLTPSQVVEKINYFLKSA